MIKDITDSKRVDTLAHTSLSPPHPIHPLILSRIFWPTLQNTQFRLPGMLATYVRIYIDGSGHCSPLFRWLQMYNNRFCTVKRDKRLNWLFSLGTVELDLELKDRTLSLEVTPLQAAIVEIFKSAGEPFYKNRIQ